MSSSRLDRAHRGLGNVGDFVALEVNMRPGGGFTPDMLNYAHAVDVYKIWADMITYDKSNQPNTPENYYCVFAGRRDGVTYRLDHNAMMEKYRYALKQWDRMPEASHQLWATRLTSHSSAQSRRRITSSLTFTTESKPHNVPSSVNCLYKNERTIPQMVQSLPESRHGIQGLRRQRSRNDSLPFTGRPLL